LAGRSTIKANVKDQQVSGDLRFTDIWVQQGSRWLAVASQVTRIARIGTIASRPDEAIPAQFAQGGEIDVRS
jgi:hypothetical protein